MSEEVERANEMQARLWNPNSDRSLELLEKLDARHANDLVARCQQIAEANVLHLDRSPISCPIKDMVSRHNGGENAASLDRKPC